MYLLIRTRAYGINLNDGSGIDVRIRIELPCLIQFGNTNCTLCRVCGLVANGFRNRRGARCTLSFILALDEAVGDTENGIDNDGVNAFSNLVL